MRPKGVIIRTLSIWVISLGVVVVPNSEVVFCLVGILFVRLISLRVSLVNLFRQHFRLLTEVNLVPETAWSR